MDENAQPVKRGNGQRESAWHQHGLLGVAAAGGFADRVDEATVGDDMAHEQGAGPIVASGDQHQARGVAPRPPRGKPEIAPDVNWEDPAGK